MHVWNRSVTFTGREEIQRAIKDDAWQSFRLSLKGLSTEDKLYRLDNYLVSRELNGGVSRDEQVRVDNYINALLRGGQLKRLISGVIRVGR